MKKTIAALILALPLSAFAAAATWSAVSTTDLCELPGRTWSNGNCRSVKAVCASGTCDAPTLATQGMSLDSVATYKVSIVAPATKTVAGGKLKFYWYSPGAGKWIPDSSKDLTIPAAAANAYTFDGDSPGLGIPVLLPKGRAAYVVDSSTAADGCTTYIEATSASGASL